MKTTLTVPAKPADQKDKKEETSATTPMSQKKKVFIDHSKPTIAFAHDDRFFLDPLIKKLASEERRFNIIDCINAKEVLALFSEGKFNKPCLVISDLRLRHGGAFKHSETGAEMYTGKTLYEYIRGHYGQTIAFFMFTSDSSEYTRMCSVKNDPFFKIFSAGHQKLATSIIENIESFFPRSGPKQVRTRNLA
jgi:hypothetical protein